MAHPAINGTVTYLQSSEIIGPTVVDVASMITPRTIIDSTRSPEAGVETFRREASSTANVFLLPGIYALGMGWLLNNFRKNKAPNLAIDNGSIDALKTAWNNSGNVDDYAKNIIENLRGAVGTEEARALPRDKTGKLSEDLAKAIKEKSLHKLKAVEEDAIKALGAEKSITLHGTGTNMSTLFKNAAKMHENVFNKFGHEALHDVIEGMKNLNVQKTWLGLGIAAGIALGIQYTNRYLTKLKTGTDAFVGLPHYDELKDKSESENAPEDKKKNGIGLFAGKVAASILMAYMVGASISETKHPIKAFKIFGNIPELYKKLEFKGKIPTMNQLKVLIGTTFVGRYFAATDGNELRESTFRDTLTYLNLLIIGGLISSGTAFALALKNKLNPSLLFNGPKLEKEGFWGNISTILNKMSQKSMAEIEVLKEADTTKNILKGIHNKSYITGIVSSCLALGLVTPWLNKHITNKLVNKKEEQPQNSNTDGHKSVSTTQTGNFNRNMKVVQSVLGDFGSSPGDGVKRAVTKEFVYSQFFAS